MMPPNGLAGKRASKRSSAWPIELKLSVRYIDTPRTCRMADQVIVIVIEPTIDVGNVDGGNISGDICNRRRDSPRTKSPYRATVSKTPPSYVLDPRNR